ncbi:DUF7604 domain-containing protein [Bifidobacterium platyrrhinorum]|nr:VWA domain-containing protein [Bifidobacterium platyrrhinorum]
MKKISQWLAAVGSAASKGSTRFVAVLAAVAMLGGVAGVSATAMADDDTADAQGGTATAAATDAELGVPAHSKTVKANGDGTYTISLNVTGDSQESSEQTRQPIDIVVVADTSGSMNEDMDGNECTDWSGRQQVECDNSRLSIAKNAITSMANSLLTDANAQLPVGQQIQMSVVSFATKASSATRFTANAGSVSNTVNGFDANGGTNWEAALKQANAATSGRANAKKYIVFLSDGDPTYRLSRVQTGTDWRGNPIYDQDENDYNDIPSGVHGNGRKDSYGANLNSAVAEANKRGDATLYSVGVSSDATKMNSFAASVNGKYYSATNTDSLNQAFSAIIDDIKKSATYQNVKITDKLSGWFVPVTPSAGDAGVPDASGFTYTKSNDPNWNGANTTVTPNADGTFTWDLSGLGKLEKGVTYTVSFTVKGTQAAYDSAARNHKDDPNAEGDNNFYTNDGASISYDKVKSETGKEDVVTPGRADYNQPTATLPVSKITVTKQWADGNENHAGGSVTVRLKQDGKDYGDPITLNADNKWTRDVAVPAGPEGHKYTVTEVNVPGYNSTVDKAELELKGLPAQAGAFTVTNSVAAVALPSTDLKVTKTIRGKRLSGDQAFSFTLQCKDGNGYGKCADVSGLDEGGRLTAQVKASDFKASANDATVAFGAAGKDLKFRVPTTGDSLTYRFEVTEDTGSKLPGWKYDDQAKTVTVTIRKGDDGQWKAVAGDPAKFTNQYVAISALPLTGGTTGRTWMVAGSVLTVIAVLAASGYGVTRRRRLI